jgi:predicted amidohydrolase
MVGKVRIEKVQLDQSESTLTVSILQASAKTVTPEVRLNQLDKALEEASYMGADILVCPELFMSGYVSAERSKRLAEPTDGPFAAAVSALAARYEIAVAYGYPERQGQSVYNSMLVFGPDGEKLASYQKSCFPPGFDTDCFVPGTSDALFTLKGILCGCLICYDVEFPENVRRLAMKGVELVVVPTALLDKWVFVSEKLVPTRAFENGISIAYANFAGDSQDAYGGLSRCVDPLGQSIALAGQGVELLTAKLTPAVRLLQQLPYLTVANNLRCTKI